MKYHYKFPSTHLGQHAAELSDGYFTGGGENPDFDFSGRISLS